MKHGRLIDADALYKNICDSLNAMTTIGIAVDGEWLWAKLNDAIENAQTIEPEQRWIPCSERLPEGAYPVIVTWKNDDPVSYYQYILGKHYVGVAHYKNGKWFWYSSITEDVLMEYGRCDSEEFDEAINVLAWMPLPEPWRGEGEPK